MWGSIRQHPSLTAQLSPSLSPAQLVLAAGVECTKTPTLPSRRRERVPFPSLHTGRYAGRWVGICRDLTERHCIPTWIRTRTLLFSPPLSSSQTETHLALLV